MDQVGLAAALFDEDEPERAAAAGHQALNTAGLQSALVVSRVNSLVVAAARYRTPAVAASDRLHPLATDRPAARGSTQTPPTHWSPSTGAAGPRSTDHASIARSTAAPATCTPTAPVHSLHGTASPTSLPGLPSTSKQPGPGVAELAPGEEDQ